MSDQLHNMQWKCEVCGDLTDNPDKVDQHIKDIGHVNAGVEVGQGNGKTVEDSSGISQETIPAKSGQRSPLEGARGTQDEAENTFDETAS